MEKQNQNRFSIRVLEVWLLSFLVGVVSQDAKVTSAIFFLAAVIAWVRFPKTRIVLVLAMAGFFWGWAWGVPPGHEMPFAYLKPDIPKTGNQQVDQFVRASFFGDRTTLKKSVKNSFRRAGLYHLLVVSGLHIATLGIFLTGLLRLPAQIGYSLMAIKPSVWVSMKSFLAACSILIMFIYICLIGAPPSSQRALLVQGVYSMTLVFIGKMPTYSRILWVVTLQTIVFPGTFLMWGTLLSWSAYLVVLSHASVWSKALSQSQYGKFYRSLFLCQVKLTIITGAIIGQLSIIGVVANIVLIPIFSVTFITMLLSMSLSYWDDGFILVGTALVEVFLGLVKSIANITYNFNWLYFELGDYLWARIALVVGAGWILLNTLRDLTIRS